MLTINTVAFIYIDFFPFFHPDKKQSHAPVDIFITNTVALNKYFTFFSAKTKKACLTPTMKISPPLSLTMAQECARRASPETMPRGPSFQPLRAGPDMM